MNEPVFCSTPLWNPLGITVINGSAQGFYPNSIFIDQNNTVYVSSINQTHLRIWPEGNFSQPFNRTNHLNHSESLFVSSTGEIYVDNGAAHHRIEKWSWSDSNATIVMHINSSCISLFLGPNQTLYCSVSNQHSVLRQSLEKMNSSVIRVAGTGASGNTSNMLHEPRGIYVRDNGDFYVADCGNDRVQYFQEGQQNATTVLGAGSTQEHIILDCPSSIILDGNGYLYLIDMKQHRVIGSNSYGFRCILGCLGQGNDPSHLNHPSSFSFDRDGNIFVVDRENKRLQKFLLARNACGSSFSLLLHFHQ